MSQATVASAGLTTDMQNLANAINQNLNQAMAAAIVQAGGGQKAFDSFANSVLGAKGNISQMVPAAQQLATTMLSELGGNVTQTKGEFETFAIQLGLTKGQADQLWADVQGPAVAALQANKNAADTTKTAHQQLGSQFDTTRSKADTMGGDLAGNVSGDMTTAGVHASDLKNTYLAPLATALENVMNWADNMGKAIGLIPTSHSTSVHVSGSGGASITSSLPGIGGILNILGLAGGGVVPGYSPGQDTVPAMLSPGEGVLTPQAVRMVGEGTVHTLNAQAKGYADGGIVGSLPDIGGWANNLYQAGSAGITDLFQNALTNALKSLVENAVSAVTNAAKSALGLAEGGIVPGGPVNAGLYDSGGLLMPGLTLAMNNTGQPERVIGPGGSSGPEVIHVSLNLDGSRLAEKMIPYSTAANARYGIRNAGHATGLWKPGTTT
jgi:hypothetical protein